MFYCSFIGKNKLFFKENEVQMHNKTILNCTNPSFLCADLNQSTLNSVFPVPVLVVVEFSGLPSVSQCLCGNGCA